jgi:hypothetical protein
MLHGHGIDIFIYLFNNSPMMWKTTTLNSTKSQEHSWILGNTIQQFETATKGQSKISKLAVSVILEHRKGTKFFFPLSPHIFTWLPKKDCLIVKILCNSMTRSYWHTCEGPPLFSYRSNGVLCMCLFLKLFQFSPSTS